MQAYQVDIDLVLVLHIAGPETFLAQAVTDAFDNPRGQLQLADRGLLVAGLHVCFCSAVVDLPPQLRITIIAGHGLGRCIAFERLFQLIPVPGKFTDRIPGFRRLGLGASLLRDGQGFVGLFRRVVVALLFAAGQGQSQQALRLVVHFTSRRCALVRLQEQRVGLFQALAFELQVAQGQQVDGDGLLQSDFPSLRDGTLKILLR